MNTDNAPKHHDPTRDLARVTPLASGHIGANLSTVGLEFARVIHRPCVDAAFAAPARVPTAHHNDMARAKRDRFDSMIRPGYASVVVTPCTMLPALAESSLRSNLDVEPFHRHLRNHAEFVVHSSILSPDPILSKGRQHDHRRQSIHTSGR
jgi:hypothetical protein